MQESQSPCTFFFSSEISCNSDQQNSMKTLNDRAICSPHSCAYMENLKQWKINNKESRWQHSPRCSSSPSPVPGASWYTGTLQTPVFQLCPSSPSCLSTVCRRVFYHSEDQSWGGSRVLTLTLGRLQCLNGDTSPGMAWASVFSKPFPFYDLGENSKFKLYWNLHC